MGIYNHTGQVVTDLERAKRFYQEVFGFKFWYEIQPPDEATAKLNCLEPPLGITASYLVLDGFVLELMHYAVAGAAAPYRHAHDERTRLDAPFDFGGRRARRRDQGGRIRRRDH